MKTQSPIFFSLMGTREEELFNTYRGFSQTGQYLISVNSEGDILPTGIADDLGLYFWLNKIAQNLNIDILFCYKSLILISATLGVFMIGLGAIKLSIKKLGIYSIGTLGLIFFMSIYFADVYSLNLIPICFLPLVFHKLSNKENRARVLFFVLIIGGLLSGFTETIRSFSGIVFLLYCIPLILLSKLTFSHKAISTILALVFFYLPIQTVNRAIEERNNWLLENNIVQSIDFHDRHVFWHSVYIGLGYYTDKYVEDYEDSVALDFVNRKNPEVEYCSLEYNEILKNEVIKIAKTDPFWTSGQLLKKFLHALLYVLVFANIGLLWWHRNLFLHNHIIIIALVYLIMLTPVVLVVPRLRYMLGSLYFVLVLNIMFFQSSSGSQILKSFASRINRE